MTPKIIFVGNAGFGAIILDGLIKNGYKPCLVIAEPDKPAGRHQILVPPPVKLIAQKHKIPLSQPERILDSKFQIQDSKADLIIVAAYGQILPRTILELPKYGCLNAHPSLLPKYRGPSPIQTAILNGDKETGVSIILMDEKIDHGSIITSGIKQITNNRINYKELEKQLAELSAELLTKLISGWIEGKIKTLAQDDSVATYTKIIKKDDGKINWQKTAEAIERQIRAFDPWPGTFTFWQKDDKNKLLRIKILQAKSAKLTDHNNLALGQTFIGQNGNLYVTCQENFLLLEKLQPEGKKPINAKDFLLGHKEFAKTILK